MEFAFSQQGMELAKAFLIRSMERKKATVLLKLRLETCKQQMDCLPGQGTMEEKTLFTLLQARQAEVTAALQKWVETDAEIKSTIHAVPDSMQRTVLEMRYVHHISYFDIAEQLHMDERHIYRVHRKALQMAALVLLHQGKITAGQAEAAAAGEGRLPFCTAVCPGA